MALFAYLGVLVLAFASSARCSSTHLITCHHGAVFCRGECWPSARHKQLCKCFAEPTNTAEPSNKPSSSHSRTVFAVYWKRYSSSVQLSPAQTRWRGDLQRRKPVCGRQVRYIYTHKCRGWRADKTFSSISCCSTGGICGYGPTYCGNGNCTSNCDALG